MHVQPTARTSTSKKPCCVSAATQPHSEVNQAQSVEYWSQLIAAAGTNLPRFREASRHVGRPERRIERQRARRLVRLLPTAHRAVALELEVAA